MMYKILVIPGARDALGAQLDLGEELARLSTLGDRFNNLIVETLPEGLSELDVTSYLASNVVDADAIHLLGHADDAGFYLVGDEIVTAPSLKSICRASGARTVFINSCGSAQMGQYLVNNGVAVAICYAVPVMDRAAIINAVRFYGALAKSNDPFQDGLREGYQVADPGDGSLLWLTNGQYVQQIIEPIIARIDALDGTQSSKFNNFQNALRKIERDVSGRIDRLASQSSRVKASLVAVLASVLVAIFVIIWATGSFANAQTIPGDTIPPTRKPTPIHPPTPVLPTRKPTKTTKPIPTERPSSTPIPTEKPTGTPIPTERPSSTPILTEEPSSTPIPTEKPTGTPIPTEKPTGTPIPTEKPSSTPIPTEKPTGTPIPTEKPTGTPIPTEVPTSTPIPTEKPSSTVDPFVSAVATAVRATLTALPECECKNPTTN